MITMQCRCGGSLTAHESQIKQPQKCLACGAVLNCMSAEALHEGAGAADFDAGLWVICRPSLQALAWRLGGCEAIRVGASAEQTIRLDDPFVSAAHCQLVRVDFGPSRWRLEDLGSENGVFVNSQRIAQHELRHCDAIQIGNVELVYELDSERAPVAPPPTPEASRASQKSPAAAITCPSCEKSMRVGAKICVPCGIYLDTGRPLLTSQVDENAVYAAAEPLVQVASFLVPLTILPIPIAADGRGKHRPYVIWAIAAITVLVSLIFLIAGFSDESAMSDLMLWPVNSGQFHAYQLLTNVLLHDRGSIIGFLLHLGGNMLFLLVFGSRVNSLIGNLATAIIYPLLAIASGFVYLVTLSPAQAMPALGASGAINGLAGMYLVLLPGHRVYCAMWIRIISFSLFRTYFAMKIFAIRGFWVLLIYFGYDVLIVSVGWQDSTAHWAHIGGFLTGAAIGMGLLLSKRFNCTNGDLLSVLLGKHAWPIIGKPSRWSVGQAA